METFFAFIIIAVSTFAIIKICSIYIYIYTNNEKYVIKIAIIIKLNLLVKNRIYQNWQDKLKIYIVKVVDR